MRIAHFVQRYPPALGGSEAYFARLSRYLVEQGHQVTVFTTTALDLEAFWSRRGRCLPAGSSWDQGVLVRRFPLVRLPAQRWLLKPCRLIPHRTLQLLGMGHNPLAPGMWSAAGRTAEAFDIVHATAFPYGWPLACAQRLAQRLHVPLILTPFVHTGDPEDPRDRTRRAYTRPALLSVAHSATRVIVQTEVERQALVAVGIDADKLLIQGMGVDLATCTGGDRSTTRQAWGLAPDAVVIGHLANCSYEKGTIDLLRACALAWSEGANFEVVLAGAEMPNFRQFWSTYAESGRVRRLGVLSDAEKRNFFASLDVFALPSRSDSFGIVLLEAWANGIPNLAYRAGGIAGVIRDTLDGVLVRCGDLRALATALHNVSRSAVMRAELGTAGRERTLREYRWESKLRQVEECYHDAMGEKPQD